jgi:predicted exporter
VKPGQVIALALSYILLGLCALIVTVSVNLRSDLSFVFPRDADADLELLADRLQKGPAAGLLLLAISGGTTQERVEVSNRLAETLAGSDRFRFVANGRLRPPGAELPALFEKRYLLNPAVDAADFTPDALRAALEEALAALGTASGLATQQLLPADPTGRLRQVTDFWSSRSQSARPGGIWLSKDGATALIMAETAGPAFDLGDQERTLDFIASAFDGLRGELPLSLDVTGPSVFATTTSRVIRREMQSLTLSSAVLVILLLTVTFRSLSLVCVLLLPLGFGVCMGALAVQVLFGELHGITLAFGGTLIGVAVDYPIHLASHNSLGVGAKAALRKIWATLRLGLLTTVVGFLPITLSSFPGLSQLGTFAIAGLATAALTTRVLLPHILPPLAERKTSRIWDEIQNSAGKLSHLRPLLLVMSLAALGFIATRGPAIWETDLRNLSPTPASARDLDRRLRNELGAVDVRHLLVLRRATLQAVLRDSEALAEDLEALVDGGQVAGFDMAAHYLPSRERQMRRQAELPDRGTLNSAVEAAAAGLPFRPGTFAPFLDGVERSKFGPATTLADFEAAGLAWRLTPLLFQQGGGWVGLIVPRGLEAPEALAAFVAGREDDGFSYLDLKRGSELLVADYRREALRWLAIGAVFALVLLLAGLRSLKRLLRVVTPVCLSLVFTVALLAAFGVSLSLFHLLSLLLVAGVGLDYALFFDRYASSREDAVPTLRANVICAMTTVTVFTILASSHIPVLHGIGTTVALGAAFALAFAILFAETGGTAER